MSASRYIYLFSPRYTVVYVRIYPFLCVLYTAPVGCVMCVAAHTLRCVRYGRVGATADEQKGQHCWRHRGADLFAPHQRTGGVGGGSIGVTTRAISLNIQTTTTLAPLIHFSPPLSLLLSTVEPIQQLCPPLQKTFSQSYMYMYAFFQTAFDFFLIDLRFRKSIGAVPVRTPCKLQTPRRLLKICFYIF